MGNEQGVGARFQSHGDAQFSLIHQNRKRLYLLHVPQRSDLVANTIDGGGGTGCNECVRRRIRFKTPPSVVVVFHGGGGDGNSTQKLTAFDALADRVARETESAATPAPWFIVVYPFGSNALFEQKLLTWNAGKGCGYAQEKNVDDVGFVKALLDDLWTKIEYDTTRVFAVGHSNGGMLSHRLGVEMGERFAAVAAVSGTLMVHQFNPKRPIPVMQIHSIDDPVVHYKGGPGLNNIIHTSIDSTLEHWIKFNQCNPNPVLEKTQTWMSPSGSQHTAIKYRYIGSPQHPYAEVVFWQMKGVSHTWPGSTHTRILTKLIGEETHVLDASFEAWEFFKNHQLLSMTNHSSSK